jgi:hypothetical protein
MRSERGDDITPSAPLQMEIATGKLTGAIQKADHDRFVGEYLDKVVQIQ